MNDNGVMVTLKSFVNNHSITRYEFRGFKDGEETRTDVLINFINELKADGVSEERLNSLFFIQRKRVDEGEDPVFDQFVLMRDNVWWFRMIGSISTDVFSEKVTFQNGADFFGEIVFDTPPMVIIEGTDNIKYKSNFVINEPEFPESVHAKDQTNVINASMVNKLIIELE